MTWIRVLVSATTRVVNAECGVKSIPGEEQPVDVPVCAANITRVVEGVGSYGLRRSTRESKSDNGSRRGEYLTFNVYTILELVSSNRAKKPSFSHCHVNTWGYEPALGFAISRREEGKVAQLETPDALGALPA